MREMWMAARYPLAAHMPPIRASAAPAVQAKAKEASAANGDISASTAPMQLVRAGGCGCAQCSREKARADEEERLREAGIQRAVDPDGGPMRVDAGAVQARLTGGAPLPGPVADRFSEAYGRDLSHVRVHEGSALAPQIGARAFTVGRDVAFAPGEYRPGTPEGDRLIGHELAHVVQQAGGAGTVQGSGLGEDGYEREADRAAEAAVSGGSVSGLSPVGARSVQRAPKAPPAAEAPPTAEDPGQAVDEEEVRRQEIERVKKEEPLVQRVSGLAGQLAGIVRTRSSAQIFSSGADAMERAQRRKEATVELRFGAFVPRTVRSDKSKGFDAVGPAAAFALSVAHDGGAAVVREGNVYFVVRLAPVGGGLTRDRVYDFEPRGKVVMAMGQDGFTFSARSDEGRKGEYEPDEGFASARSRADRPEDYMARPPPAGEMAKLIGMHRPEEGFGKETQEFVDQDAVMMLGDTEILLRQYFAARALEILERNEQQALDEMTLYRGAPPGQDSTKKMPDEVQLRIAITRAEGLKLNQLLEREIELEELESKLGREQSTSLASVSKVELIPGQKAEMILTWRERLADAKSVVKAARTRVLRDNPLLAQLVDVRNERSQLRIDLRYAYDKTIGRSAAATGAAAIASPAAGAVAGAVKAWDAISPNNPYQDSLLNTAPSEAADEAIRSSYIEKLDAVLKAVGKVKVEVLSADLRTLAAMPGLRQRVMADLASIKGPNARLGEFAQIVLSRLGSSPGDIAATVIEVAGIALQLAGFFFPPAEFLGSVLTFGASAYKMSRALDNWEVSRASLTGEDGLVDRAQAEAALIDQALDVAAQALTVGVTANSALKAMEEGGSARKILDRMEKGAGKDAAAEARVKGHGPVETHDPTDPLSDLYDDNYTMRDTLGWAGKRKEGVAGAHLDYIDGGVTFMDASEPELRKYIDRLLDPKQRPPKFEEMAAPIEDELVKLTTSADTWNPKSPRYAAQQSRYRELTKQHAALDAELVIYRKSALREAEELLSGFVQKNVADESRRNAGAALAKRYTIDASAQGALAAANRRVPAVQKDIADYYVLTGTAPDPSFSLTYVEPRAHHNIDLRRVNVGDKFDRRTVFHEFGHNVEYTFPDVADATRDFMAARGTRAARRFTDEEIAATRGLGEGKELRREGNVVQLWGETSETKQPIWYTVGDFFEGYVGRSYGAGSKATEVMSKGLEKMRSPAQMLDLYRRDPEHFFLLLGVLKGIHR